MGKLIIEIERRAPPFVFKLRPPTVAAPSRFDEAKESSTCNGELGAWPWQRSCARNVALHSGTLRVARAVRARSS